MMPTADAAAAPPKKKKNVVLGMLGVTRDCPRLDRRWQMWRPTVGVCWQPGFAVDRLDLIHDAKHEAGAERVERDIAKVAEGTQVARHVIDFDDPWDFEEVYEKLYDFARAYPFRPEREDYFIHITTGTHVAQICLFLLAEARYLPGRLIQSAPDPASENGVAGRVAIIDLDLSRYDRLASRFAMEQRDTQDFLKAGIATKNRAFNALIAEIEQVAGRSRAPILLGGPTGAGKTQLARRIYELKRARQGLAGRFVEVNCATVRGDAAMSALFGHTRGAFTGALKDRDGLLRAADGGVLFLDEIGELGADEQAMLLRAVEEKRFLPLGSDRERSSDFQLIAGTNRDLAARAAEGKFRADLLARINLWAFALPALADRREDIAPNLDFELERFAQLSGERVTFNKEARDRFLKFARTAPWPGNFRDLNAAVTRLGTLAKGGRITAAGVDHEIARLAQAWAKPAESAAGTELDLEAWLGVEAAAAIDPFDRHQLGYVIRVCRESRTLADAGRQLFSASRQKRAAPNDSDRVRKYLAKFGLDWAAVTA